MKDFWKKLYKYLDENYDFIATDDVKDRLPFIYSNSEIEYDIALQLANMNERVEFLANGFDEKNDFIRLLRKENKELTSELNSLYEEKATDKHITIDISGGLPN